MAAEVISPIKTLDDAEALAWLKAQPEGRSTLPPAELGRRWGWPRYRVTRRLKAWAKAGHVTRRGNTIRLADGAGQKAAVVTARSKVQHPDNTPDLHKTIAALVAAQNAPIAAPVAPSSDAPVARPAAPSTGITVCTTIAALALAAVSAGFSVTGMTSIFVGAYWPVIGMGIALEAGKLAAVAWLGRHHTAAPWRLKAALTALITVLIALNAIGAYGFLAKAHIEHATAGEITAMDRAADIEARISVQAAIVSDLDRRIAQIDGAVSKAVERGRAVGAMQLASDQRKARTDLVGQRIREARALAALQVEKATADGERRKADADLGPVKYLAALTGASDDVVLRYFILAVALLLDPAAVLLLLAATRKNEIPR